MFAVGLKRGRSGAEKMTWEELQAVKNHQHYDSYYEAY
jgi:hypothetical protein